MSPSSSYFQSQSDSKSKHPKQRCSLVQIVEEPVEFKKYKVLVVNDESMQLWAISYKFESTGKCDVEQAVNGFEAFEMVMKKFNAQP